MKPWNGLINAFTVQLQYLKKLSFSTGGIFYFFLQMTEEEKMKGVPILIIALVSLLAVACAPFNF